MVLALPLRLLRWAFSRITALCTRLSQQLCSLLLLSPPLRPAAWALDPDLLTEELKDPALRQFYLDHLENCLAMPSRQRTQ